MNKPTKLPSPKVLAIRQMAEDARKRDEELTTSQTEHEKQANALLCKDQGQHKKAEYCDGIMI